MNLHAIRAVMNTPSYTPSEPLTLPLKWVGGQPRHRLAELISLLKYKYKGYTWRIAHRCHCSPTTVSNVLNGKQTQHSDLARNIIRVAERMVEHL